MEALVAVGLASNVLQFVDFATQLVSKARELREDLTSSDHKDYDAIAAHLQVLAGKVSASVHSIAQSSTASPEEDIQKALQPVADGCCELAKKLLERLNSLDLLSAQSGGRLRRSKAAWRWVWNKKETEEIAERLHYFGSQLALHMTYQIKQSQLEQRTWQPNKNDIQAILARTDDVLLSIDSLKLGIEKLDERHEDVLGSIKDLGSLSSQLQAQTTQEVTSASRETSERISDLEASFNASMLKQNEDVRTHSSKILESLATVRVENSELHSRVTQVLPQDRSFDNTSLQHVLRSVLDEYQESFLSEIRKEFRGTARSEMESMRAQALQALDGMQSGRKACASEIQSGLEVVVKPSFHPSMPARATKGSKEATLESREHRRQQKSNITMLYATVWGVETRIGTFWLNIRDKVIFDPVKPPVNVYELTTHFIPSPRWCSKGFHVAYQKVADPRGIPKFGLRLESYCVLDDDHKTWAAIRQHDTDSVRNMLAERVISPNDRDTYGMTLLGVSFKFSSSIGLVNTNVNKLAVVSGGLDTVKALIHSGADINAVDSMGLNPICWAIIGELVFHGYGQEAFYYLQGLSSINMQDLWLNPSIGIATLCFILGIHEYNNAKDVKKAILNWASLCRTTDLDLDIPGEETFLEMAIDEFWDKLGDHECSPYENFHLITAFDLLLDEVAITYPIFASEIPMYYAAIKLLGELDTAQKSACIAQNASATLPVSYHRYYISQTYAQALNFLEHVMTKAIAQRPDCIFDTGEGYGCDDDTVCRRFRRYGFWDIWEDILEDHGFDPSWVVEEDKKRRYTWTAETSTHEVSVDVDATRALEVKRRRGYVNAEE
ncbi:hypothetical protein Hte_003976 [Hypoxylon texense]